MSQLRVPVGPDDHVQGNAKAPVTLVEYGDFECPYCGAAYLVLKEIQRQMGEGVRFVFRQFPLAESHPHALAAAEASEAASAQGKFWPMHDLLYEHQTALGNVHLVGYARELGLDLNRFSKETEGHVYRARIEEDFRGGIRSGVNGTPSLFINGLRYDGPVDAKPLLAALKAATKT
jgi:protein-disulfide isomerase